MYLSLLWRLVMAIYYLKSNGTNVSPYSSEATAATSMWSIRALPGFASTDTIILCDDVTDTTFDGANYTKMCNIIAKDGVTYPSYHYNVGSGGPWNGSSSITTITGIKFIQTNASASSFYGPVKCINCIVENRSNKAVYTGNAIGNEFIRSLFVSTYDTVSVPTFMNGGTYMTINNCTFISNATSFTCPIIDGFSTITNSIFYIPNKSNGAFLMVEGGTVTDWNSVSSNIWYSKSEMSFINYQGSYPTGINNTFVNPLFEETTTYTLSKQSSAIGAGIGGVNIGWDLITKIITQSIKCSTSSSSYFGNEFFPPITGGVGHVPHAF